MFDHVGYPTNCTSLFAQFSPFSPADMRQPVSSLQNCVYHGCFLATRTSFFQFPLSKINSYLNLLKTT